ncbi:unnamed protein product, partial [Cyprideis torosa]
MADLWYAIRVKRVGKAIALIQGGADVEWTHEESRLTALHEAALRANPCLVSLLLQHGAWVEAEDRGKRTPLLEASGWFWSSPSEEEARLECVKILLQAGANIRHCDKDGNNALHYATSSRSLSIAQHLLTVDPSLCLVKNSQGEAALTLQQAAEWGRPAIISILLQHGLEVDEEDNEKRTPLLVAIGRWSSSPSEEARLECVKILLQAGANIRHCDKNGKNALHHATSNRYRSIAQHLLTVDPSLCLVKNSQGEAALTLQQAAEWGRPAIISILLQHGARVDDEGDQKLTPLLWAIGWNFFDENDRLEWVKILLGRGANVRHCDKWGNNALHYATSSGYLSIAQHLLTVDPSLCLVKNSFGETALHVAADKAQPASIALLLRHGLEVDEEDNEKRTPLLVAIGRESSPSEEARLEWVKILLQAGANIRHCDKNGKNALHHATSNRY